MARPSFISRTPNKYQKSEQLFYFLLFKSYNPDIHELCGKRFCVCYPQALEKVPHTESDTFSFPWMDSHDSSPILVDLQYDSSTIL